MKKNFSIKKLGTRLWYNCLDKGVKGYLTYDNQFLMKKNDDEYVLHYEYVKKFFGKNVKEIYGLYLDKISGDPSEYHNFSQWIDIEITFFHTLDWHSGGMFTKRELRKIEKLVLKESYDGMCF